MTLSSEPVARLSHLPSADGSATFSYAGYEMVGSVNGPIEVQRRDELPEEAVIDVVVRPAQGVGGTRERHLESLLEATLRKIILVQNFPRTLIQITLQVLETPENEYVNAKTTQAGSNLPILPALMQTAVLSLLSAAIPMTATLASAVFAVTAADGNTSIVAEPSAREIEHARSLHVFSFTSHGDLLLAESEGEFTLDIWNEVFAQAQRQSCPAAQSDDVDMGDGMQAGTDLSSFTRAVVESKIASDLYWKS